MLPDAIGACVGGGSNAIGLFTAFLDDPEVEVGGELAGEIRITGGSHEQDIKGVVLSIATRALVETRGDDKVYAEVTLGETTLNPGRVGAGARVTDCVL